MELLYTRKAVDGLSEETPPKKSFGGVGEQDELGNAMHEALHSHERFSFRVSYTKQERTIWCRTVMRELTELGIFNERNILEKIWFFSLRHCYRQYKTPASEGVAMVRTSDSILCDLQFRSGAYNAEESEMQHLVFMTKVMMCTCSEVEWVDNASSANSGTLAPPLANNGAFKLSKFDLSANAEDQMMTIPLGQIRFSQSHIYPERKDFLDLIKKCSLEDEFKEIKHAVPKTALPIEVCCVCVANESRIFVVDGNRRLAAYKLVLGPDVMITVKRRAPTSNLQSVMSYKLDPIGIGDDIGKMVVIRIKGEHPLQACVMCRTMENITFRSVLTQNTQLRIEMERDLDFFRVGIREQAAPLQYVPDSLYQTIQKRNGAPGE